MRFKRFISLLVLFVLATTLVVQSAYCCEEEKSSGFSDISQSHWAYKAILNMSSRKIINGFPDNTFKPDLSITRAEFAKIMVLALNLPQKPPDSSSFLDINKTDWECPYVENAKYYLTGFRGPLGDSFHPKEPAVREDMAVALVKAMNLSGENSDSSILDRFADKNNISENLKKYISIAVNHKIMEGSKDGNNLTFKPKNSLTRAEAAVLLNNVTSEEKITFDEEKVTYDDKNKQPVVTVPATDKPSGYAVPKLEASIGDGKIYLKWLPIYDNRLSYYKVVISKNNPHPKYPDDGWLCYITEKEKSYTTVDNSIKYNGGDFGEYLKPGEEYYFSITAVYSDVKIPGNVLKLKYPGSSVSPSVSKSSHTVPQMSAKVDKGRVIVNWKKISDKNLLGYKVVISKNNPHPKYPDDGYMFWITERNTTSAVIEEDNNYNGGDVGGHLVSGKDYYFSVTAFYEDEKIPGNVVRLTFP
ncbi:MAG TPA: S-layer homology domain-containing protein [Clostridia bacterium]